VQACVTCDLLAIAKFLLGVCMDKYRSNLTRFLYTFTLYEVTVAVALFVYVVVFIVFLCVVS